MADKFPSDKQDKFMLRLPVGMRDKIAQEAKSNSRSMNAEIVQRLEASFRRSVDDDEVIKRVTEISAKAAEAIAQREAAVTVYKASAAITANVLKTTLNRLVHLSGSTEDDAHLAQFIAAAERATGTFGEGAPDNASLIKKMDEAIETMESKAGSAKSKKDTR